MAKQTVSRKKSKGATAVNDAAMQRVPGWLWLITGVALGLFVAFLIFLQKKPASLEQVKETITEKKAKVVEEVENAGRRFDFYSLLPKMEVVVPESEPVKNSQNGHEVKPGTYSIQTGSFRNFADADRQKAQLALLGVQSGIHAAVVDDGVTWHRVRIGPLGKADEIRDLQKLLKQNGYQILMIKIKG